MAKPVTPHDIFDMWQKMVNPGAYPLQSLMFPVADPAELEKKIAELEVVEHWLRANLNMLGLTIKSLQVQRAMVKGGEKFREQLAAQGQPASPTGEGPADHPGTWAWNMMANAGREAMGAAQAATPKAAKPRRKKKA